MRVYIIGKVSGLERQVYLNNFARAEKALSNAGFRTINAAVQAGVELVAVYA